MIRCRRREGDRLSIAASRPMFMGEVKTEKDEPTRRLSIDLPKSLHRRFKTACTKADKKMIVEVTKFIERRTAELEKD